jgi:hypothetical protein
MKTNCPWENQRGWLSYSEWWEQIWLNELIKIGLMGRKNTVDGGVYNDDTNRLLQNYHTDLKKLSKIIEVKQFFRNRLLVFLKWNALISK